jgi:hypothetical protein
MCECVSQAFGGTVNLGLRPSPETMYSFCFVLFSIQPSLKKQNYEILKAAPLVISIKSEDMHQLTDIGMFAFP